MSNRPLPPAYFFIGLSAMVALHFLLPGPGWIPGLARFLGLAPIAFGVALNLWADQLFKRYGTEVKPFRDSSALVEDGPFRFTRNPMYLGGLSIFLGVAILLGSTFPFVLIPVMFWLATAHFIRPEEDSLERQFGAVYRQYREQVRRWL